MKGSRRCIEAHAQSSAYLRGKRGAETLQVSPASLIRVTHFTHFTAPLSAPAQRKNTHYVNKPKPPSNQFIMTFCVLLTPVRTQARKQVIRGWLSLVVVEQEARGGGR